MRRVALAAAVLACAAGAPAAHAADHVELFVSESALPVGQGWRLSAVVPAPEFLGHASVSVRLARRFRGGAARESHELYADPVDGPSTVRFDGRGDAQVDRQRPAELAPHEPPPGAAGAPVPLAEYRGCTGDFARVAVTLRGRLVLRTGTRFFRNVTRQQLRGTIVFNRGGAVACAPRPGPSDCAPNSHLVAGAGLSELFASSEGRLALVFRERLRRATWVHAMAVTRVAPLAPALPTVRVEVPPSLTIVGRGTFESEGVTEHLLGACRGTVHTGRFSGSFRTTFTGWGRRTLAAWQHASYAEFR